ncbi:Rrt5 protein [Saccharomycopsis crataegensis]|uniref:Rrt5 protein n=1 Tax=Saccharomycopsis crataegensis TaxID=43959 RepID=A0AAV5QV21_9ASCO|nr:Rrt5 protein [Saccharomycopsis crataegensis]
MSSSIEKAEAGASPELESTSTPYPSSSSTITSEKNSSHIKTVCISNLDYSTSEEDIIELLKDYKVVLVIVPSQTIRGLRGKQYHKPLGIAYAELENRELATKAVKELNGKSLSGRQLRIRMYTPYVPRAKRSHHHNKSDSASKEQEKVSSTVTEKKLQEPVSIEVSETPLEPAKEPEESSKTKKEKETSKDTIFVGKLHPNTTDTDLRTFFAEYEPFEIYLFKGRYTKKNIHFSHYYVSALITVLAENGQELAIKNLSSKKLNGRYVKLRPAYLSKIEEVKQAVIEKQEEN